MERKIIKARNQSVSTTSKLLIEVITFVSAKFGLKSKKKPEFFLPSAQIKKFVTEAAKKQETIELR